MNEKFPVLKAIITKYAFSSGVQVFVGEDHSHTKDFPTSVMFVAKNPNGRGVMWDNYYHRDDWHKTKEAAAAHLKVQLEKKRKSLEKQLAGLEKKFKAAMEVIESADLTPPPPAPEE